MGSGLWYKVIYLRHWSNYINDTRYIFDGKNYNYYLDGFDFKTKELYEREFKKIEKLDRTDLIISHIPPS